jgi:flagellar hook assembly protein FlgD
LSLELPTATTVEAAIYDVSGRRVSALDSGPSAAGRRMLTWDGRDASGSPAPAGVYFARVRTDLGVRSRAIVRAN